MGKASLSLNSVRNFTSQLASVTCWQLCGLSSANRNNFHFIDEETLALRRNDFLLFPQGNPEPADEGELRSSVSSLPQ